MSDNVSPVPPGNSLDMNLKGTERDIIQNVERAGATLSLVGVGFIFIAYGMFKRLRTVPNTFILFASIANVGASIACLIGYEGILAGDASPLCQIQGFLLEMFMQSDPWWSFAMAVNVFLVFFFAANPNSFRKYLWLYSLICFGFPGLPAVICLFYMPTGTKMYGNATLWCWFSDEFNQLRIFLYYMPIWMCIMLSNIIYVCVGYSVFHQRNQLRNLTLSNQARGAVDERSSAEKGQVGLPSSYGTVTTEVQITAECSDSRTVTPPLTPTPSMTAVLHTPSNNHLQPWPSPSENRDSPRPTVSRATNNPFASVSSVTCTQVRKNTPSRRKVAFSRIRRPWNRFLRKLRNLDPIKLAYLRTSFVFALSILITWTPSSINRVYSFVHPQKTSYWLNVASAVVLPLQGLWNGIIFCATSWSTLKEEVREFKTRHWVSSDSQRLPSGEIQRRQGREHDFAGRRFDNRNYDDSSRRPSTMRVIRGGSL
ncbi:hypothetical protein B0T16DRAFT_50373 [Cercophora newfieldiana]|uniref:G-protein coupled receptors family 2 profile 2 domain-containing protein n=1 Tax=Cercophora newfieldiana TaxID=92897 RepID=A0AA39YS83_9PEZI|nr:hypothetical protein B0T16DRAFT_50373 [Cercophora newfieldiana]